MSEETRIEDIGECTGTPVAKARPKQTPSTMLSSTKIPVPYHGRKWKYVETGRFDKRCLEVSKLMIRLLRHDNTVLREDDGAVKFQDLASIFRSEFTSSSHWSIRTWLSFLQRGGGVKKRFQYCVDPSSPETLLYFRAIQGHSGGKHMDPALQDNVLSPNDFAEHIYHVGSSPRLALHNPVWIDSGWENVKKGRHAVFFTAVNPMFVDQHKEVEHDLTKPRIAVHENNWKIHQHTVYGCNLRVAQGKGFQFYQPRSNAIILYNTLPAVCIEKVVNMKSGEELYSKRYQSPELPQRIVLKPNLHCGRQDTTNFEARTSVDHLCRE